MSSIFTPPSEHTPAPTSNPPEVIAGDGFFPDIDTADLADAIRILPVITPARVREAVLQAMIDVGDQLAGCRAEWVAEGYAALAAVPAPTIGGESRLTVLYRRAISYTVKADLDEGYRDGDSTSHGRDRADGIQPTISDHRRNARWAISDMLGRPRVTVELI